MDRSTIAAIATPIGSAGIGIIRISGNDALAIAASIFRCTANQNSLNRASVFPNQDAFESHHLYHGIIVDPSDGRHLDEVLLSVMKAPHSYTREDVVEINSHSGAVILKNILSLVMLRGARLAEPGEFTRRAYLNGRIDLTQAEAVMDVITARTDKSHKMAAVHLSGQFKQLVLSTREVLLQLIAELEAIIDFPEDVDETSTLQSAAVRLSKEILLPLQELVDRYHHTHMLRDGLVLAVIGRPNVGKSSLMNRLLEKERVIVSSIPGTTRDFIEESANINGIPIVIADTAGLHETDDPIEVMGIRKTREYIDSADLILFVVEASSPLTETDQQIFATIKTKKVLLVLNKSDLIEKGFVPEIPDTWKNLPRIIVSARYNQGLEKLKALIAEVCLADQQLDVGNHIVPNLRQKQALEKCLQAASSAMAGMDATTPVDLIVFDLREAMAALDQIIGLTVKPDILDQIFSRFCIGK